MLIENDDEAQIYSVGGEGDTEGEKSIFWCLESQDMDYYLAGRKAATKLEIKLKMSEGAYFKAEVCYDGERKWHKIASENGPLNCITVSLRPRRCDSFRIRFSGHGDVTLITIKINNPPHINGDKYDMEKLMSWLYQLTLAVNMGFSNISYDNLSDDMRAELERVIGNSKIHD